MTQTAHKTKLKICLISISLAKGGAERSVAMLSQMLSRKEHDVHLVVLNDDVAFDYKASLFNLGTFKSENDNFLSRMLRFKKLRTYLLEQKFDAIIDHRPKNQYTRELFYSNYVYRNLPTVYVIHSSNEEEYLTKRPMRMAALYNKGIATVAVSKYIEKHIAAKQGVKNCETIHNAFDPSWQQPTNTEIDLPSKYVLSYGRLYDSIKDFTFLIHSYNKSALWKEGVSLVLMGDGPDKAMLQKLVSGLSCKDHILFLPFLKHPFEVIKKARCVTLTSRYEGFPMVLVESLSIGTPVVSLDIVSGPSEILNHRQNGLLIKERDTSKFADALRSVCKDEALYLELKAQTQASVTAFSMQEISDKWNQLLQHVAR